MLYIHGTKNKFMIQKNRLLLLPILSLLSSINVCVAQGWVKDYTSIIGAPESGTQVIQTADGGYIISTRKDRFFPFIIKTDAYGDTLWTKCMTWWNVLTTNDVAIIQQTDDLGYILAGGNSKKVVKLNSFGDTVWTRNIEGYASQIRQTSDGDYVVSGTYQYGMGLYKLNANGVIAWSKKLHAGSSSCMIQTRDDGFVVGGSQTIYSSTGPDTNKAILIKTDSNGDTLWTRNLGIGTPFSVMESLDNGFYFGGNINSYTAIKTNSTGYFQYGVGGCLLANGLIFDETVDTGLVYVSPSYTLIKIANDVQHSMVWARDYFADDGTRIGGRSVQQTSDNGFIVIGVRIDNLHVANCYLIKTDSEGNTSGTFPTSVENHLLSSDVKTWPNPFSNGFNIDLTSLNSGHIKLELFNLSGECTILKDDYLPTDNHAYYFQWDGPPGIYFLKISGESGGQVIQKICKTN